MFQNRDERSQFLIVHPASMDEPSKKKYTLTFTEHPEHLHAIIRCETMDRDIALAYLREIADKCSELRSRRLIVERDVPVMLPDSDLFFTTDDFMRMVPRVRVAFVNPYAQLQDQMEFAIMIGTNRGAEFSVHNTIDAAEKWLAEA
jgi:hypothetical protein